MGHIISLLKNIPVLLKTYISPHILQDGYQYFVIRGKRLTGLFPVEIHITEHCNLNCAGCNHFSPLADEECLDPKDFERDIRRLAELSPRLFALKLLGGEPLLHPNITAFFDIARNYFPTTTIQITTNGILLTKQAESFWESCRKNNIVISISRYPIKLDNKNIKALAKRHRVRLEYNGTTSENRMCKIPLDIDGKQNPVDSFKNCMISWGCCVTLRDSRLYLCCFAAHIKFFNNRFKTELGGKELAVCEKDYINIFTVKTKKEILDFLIYPSTPFCRYCKTSKTSLGEKWGISKKEITEWV